MKMGSTFPTGWRQKALYILTKFQKPTNHKKEYLQTIQKNIL